jgi:hypothetical protein
MKPKSIPVEGPEAHALFDALVRKVFSVSHEETTRREAEYKKRSATNPHRRGPKRRASKIDGIDI